MGRYTSDVFTEHVMADLTLQGLLDSIEELFSFDGQIASNDFCYSYDIETELDDVDYIKGLVEQFYKQCESNDELDKIVYAFNSIMEWYRDIAVYDEVFDYSIICQGLTMSMVTVYQYSEF